MLIKMEPSNTEGRREENIKRTVRNFKCR